MVKVEKVQVDSREKPDAIKKILRTFERNGVAYEIKKLDVGDYVDPERPNIVVDRKQNLGEVASNLFSPHDRGRFWRELKRANDNGIHLVILVEHGGSIRSIEDVAGWSSKYTHVSGRDLMERIYQVHIGYGVDFAFCDKRRTGKEILKILAGEKYGSS